MGKLRIWMLVLMLTLVGASSAQAAAQATCAGINNLQDELDAASPGDTIQMVADSDCVGESFQFSAGHVPVTIDGNGSTLDGTGIVPTGTLPILSGADVLNTTIENMTFVHGSLNSGNGAGLELTGSSTPTLINDKFLGNNNDTNNDGSGRGGAVSINTSASTGTISVSGSTFGSTSSPNSAGLTGGGLSIQGAGPGSGTPSVVLKNDSFVANHAGNSGGGLAFQASGTNGQLTISGSTFSDNTTRYGGGGASISFSGLGSGNLPHASLSHNIFVGNVAQSDSNFAQGAGLEVSGNAVGTGSLVQVGNLFRGNRIAKTTDTSSNAFFGYGAGEYDYFMPLASRSDRFVGNSITAKTTQDTIWGAGLSVGGCSEAMPVTLSDDEVAGNTSSKGAPAGGTGVYVGLVCGINGSSVTLTLKDTTVAGNTAAGGGVSGVYGGPSDSLRASNSIIAGNPGGSSNVGGFGTRTVDHSDVCAPSTPSGAGNICAAPKLVNAAAGDVHETSASPTIDKGLNAEVPVGLTMDLYGAPRITDGDGTGNAIVDIGAAESPAVPVVHCVVPKLKGKTLKKARQALNKAHCALGKVRRPKHVKRGIKLVVISQSRKPGTRLKRGSKIGVKLGRRPRHR